MDLNDPLRAKTHGYKKDYYQKEDIHYPVDNRGVVDEWRALSKTMNDQYQDQLKREKEIKIQQQRQYSDELEAARLLREKLKKEQIEKEKMQESIEVQQKQQELQQYKVRKQEEETNLKAYLRDSYKTLSDQHKNKILNEKEREMLEDQMRVARAKQSLDDENFKRLLQRAEFNQAQQELIRFRQQMKEQDKEVDEQKKENYRKMCDDNEQKLRDREDEYKRYFARYNQNLNQRQVLHDTVVGEQERLKTQRMMSWESNNDKMYQKIAEQKAYQEEVQKQNQKQNCQSWLDMQLQWKEQEKERLKMVTLQEKEVKDRQQQQLVEEDRQKKIQDQERKQMYSQALAYQKNLQLLQKQNYGKMTYEEKRINKEDLHHFKEHQAQFEAMIPGINNIKSVGAAPLKRAKPREGELPGKLKLTMSVNDLRSPLGMTSNKFNESQSLQQLGLSMHDHNPQTAQSTAYGQKFLQNITSDANIENHPMKDRIYSKRFVVDQGQYNTITNPIPNYNRNPYLNQVVSRAQMMATSPSNDVRKSHILHNAAMSQMLL
ncbi:UNKNOWN [Stylonychia lemnae]|uniref:Trichohyalin-plectin-homology domain-containing protein n=1 Tax=Stylonychia lemnae TaxID=5949 RepID=A0A078AQH2_STYLE|nr:UNKNOWN [Stylonychia lemnae]|eukprot:CDW84404.1 UNKNOWN [Stylonychia lemnae]